MPLPSDNSALVSAPLAAAPRPVSPLAALSPLWQPGDLVACYGRDLISRSISWRTHWPIHPRGLRWGPSHVAIVTPHDSGLAWAESTMLCRHPCLVQKEVVRGWQVHPIEQRLEDYRSAGGCVDVYRLAPHWIIQSHERAHLEFAAIDVWRDRHTDYDLVTALLSGSRLLRLTRFFPPADGTRLFCSEFCGIVLQSLGRLCSDENASRHNPASLLARLVRAGTYRRVRRYRGEQPIKVFHA